MEVEGSSVVVCRKRTESNGGSSDSDLSEGWNIIDHLDTNSPEAPSSDGESVEVIEAEEENSHHADADSDREVDVSVSKATQLAADTDSTGEVDVWASEANELMSQSDCQTAVTAADELPSLVLPLPREEMFDASFCWFLVTATLAVLLSHLAFMAAEDILYWNTNISSDSPSFLRDLPITPKALPQSNFAEKVSWPNDEEVIVDSVDDIFTEESGKTILEKSLLPADNKGNSNNEKLILKIDNHELGKYFKVLRDMTSSVEAQKKFTEAMLILDALHIGLSDLKEVVTDNSELNQVLKRQRNKLNDVLIEVKFGVSKSLEKLATNVLNKVQTLERRFENQWCKLEKNGHKEELKGLFYDCEDVDHGDKRNYDFSQTNFNGPESRIESDKKKDGKMQMTMDKYEVDKDSTGKVYMKKSTGSGDGNEYYKLVKDEKNNKDNRRKHISEDSANHDNIKTSQSTKEEHGKEENSRHLSNKKKNENYKIKIEKQNIKSKIRNYEKPQEGRHIANKSAEEKITKFLKDSCNKFTKAQKMPKILKKLYKKLKEEVDNKLRIPKQLFDQMYLKFCVQSPEGPKRDNKFNKEYLKRNFKEKQLKKDKLLKRQHVIVEDPVEKNVVNFKIIGSSEEKEQDVKTLSDPLNLKDNVIDPVIQQEWTLSFDILSSANKTNGYWFFKTGETRSHLRWSHQRSDWWFDRASQRRHYQYNYPHPPNWFAGRRKNWFFRRAWARQCRVSPHDSWCHLDDDTVTVPNSNFS